jgi:hypothetical protein
MPFNLTKEQSDIQRAAREFEEQKRKYLPALCRGEMRNPAPSSMAKWYCAEVGVKVADEAIQLHGG